jgi:hypothetical protein
LHRSVAISSASAETGGDRRGGLRARDWVQYRKVMRGRGAMKRLVLILLMLAQPAWAQMKLVPKDVDKQAAKRADNCAPIGRTEDGKLVYSMKCEMPPKPVAPAVAPQAAVNPAPSPDAEPKSEETETTTERSGLFGMSYDRRPKQ